MEPSSSRRRCRCVPSRTIQSPRAVAVTGETSTSPGVYATVDNQSIPSTRLPTRTPWGALVAAGGALLLALVLIGGAVVMRKKGGSDDAASSTGAPPARPRRQARPSTATIATAPAIESLDGVSRRCFTVRAGRRFIGRACNDSDSHHDGDRRGERRFNLPPNGAASRPPQPAHTTTGAATPSAKPAAPAAPRASSSAHVDKDGYVKTF